MQPPSQRVFRRTASVLSLILLVTCHEVTVARSRSRSRSLYYVDALIPSPVTVLLRSESIHRELHLTAEQTPAVEAALDEVELPLWRLRDRPYDERTEQASLLMSRLERQLSKTLSLRQFERFNQILLQAQGMHTILVPAVTERLALSSAQLGQIRTILDTMNQTMVQARQRDPARAQQIQVQAERDVVALLNSRQRSTLMSMMGGGFNLSGIRNIACRAPELRSVTAWIHTDPLKLSEMRGQVVVVHFYTYGCDNCVANLPHYNAWRRRFDAQQVQIVGIHTPETEGERDVEKVREKASEAGITYPIVVDDRSENWNAWANGVWPSVYLIDKQGFVRHWWYGQLNAQDSQGEKWMRDKIAELLREPAPVASARVSRTPTDNAGR